MGPGSLREPVLECEKYPSCMHACMGHVKLAELDKQQATGGRGAPPRGPLTSRVGSHRAVHVPELGKEQAMGGKAPPQEPLTSRMDSHRGRISQSWSNVRRAAGMASTRRSSSAMQSPCREEGGWHYHHNGHHSQGPSYPSLHDQPCSRQDDRERPTLEGHAAHSVHSWSACTPGGRWHAAQRSQASHQLVLVRAKGCEGSEAHSGGPWQHVLRQVLEQAQGQGPRGAQGRCGGRQGAQEPIPVPLQAEGTHKHTRDPGSARPHAGLLRVHPCMARGQCGETLEREAHGWQKKRRVGRRGQVCREGVEA